MMFFGLCGILLLGAVVAAVIVVAVLLLQRQGGDLSSLMPRAEPRVRQILDERLARGEISREEYQAMRAELGD